MPPKAQPAKAQKGKQAPPKPQQGQQAPQQGGKQAKKSTKVVSEVNQKSNPSASKRKGQPFEDPRGSKQTKTLQGPIRFKPTEGMTLTPVEQQAKNIIEAWYNGKANGRDAPTSKNIATWLKPRMIDLVVAPPPSEAIPHPVPIVLKDVKMKFVVHSNVPAVRFDKDRYVWHIRAENFDFLEQIIESGIFKPAEYPHDADVETFMQLFKVDHYGAALTRDDAEHFLSHGKWGKFALKEDKPMTDAPQAEVDNSSTDQPADKPMENASADQSEDKQMGDNPQNGAGTSAEESADMPMENSPADQPADKPKENAPSASDEDKPMDDAPPEPPADKDATMKDAPEASNVGNVPEDTPTSEAKEASIDAEAPKSPGFEARKQKQKEMKQAEMDRKVYGIHALTFRTKNTCWFDEIPESSNDDIVQMMEVLKWGSYVTIVRPKKVFKPVIEDFWQNRISICVMQGAWSWYDEFLGDTQGELFTRAQTERNPVLQHQYWMQHERFVEEKDKIAKFASHHAKKSFGSLREFEITQCCALIYEAMYENAVMSTYFDWHMGHKAIVRKQIDGYVQIEVSLPKHDDVAAPAISIDTKFLVRLIKDPTTMVVANDEEFDDRMDPEEDILFPERKEPPVQNTIPIPHIGDNYKGRTIEVSPEMGGDFVLSIPMKKSRDWIQFRPGSEVNVSLKMERNPIPSQRQLKAVARVAKPKAKKDGFRFQCLQNFIQGSECNPQETDKTGEVKGSLLDEVFEHITQEQGQLLQDFIDQFEPTLNKWQNDAWQSIMNNRHFVTMMQGPPGTGKTFEVALFAVTYAFMGFQTAVCAPSNVATEEALKKILAVMEEIYQSKPDAEDNNRVVYLPTTASTKQSLANPDEFVQAAYDMIEEGQGSHDDPFRKYRLHSWIVRSFESKIRLQSLGWQQASRWLAMLAGLQQGRKYARSDMKAFIDMGMEEGETVLKDPRVKIVLSTSNNADQMHLYKFKPSACIIDESAFATEQDSMVPLSLKARFNVLVGDHLQLKPIVRSRGHSEFSKQHGLSLYERFYGRYDVPLFRLRINYRMHPDIAHLPGILTYDWLGCDGSTLQESGAYKYFESWYNSPEAKFYRKNTRKPEYGGQPDEGIRVRWLNTVGSKASPKPGETSLRNFGSINAAVNLLTSIFEHAPLDPTINDLAGHNVTVLSPYKEDLAEMQRQLAWALKDKMPTFENIPDGLTIDKVQGGQNEIIILLVPPHHCQLLGFMKEWNRWNVALTRAKSVLWIVGPFESLRKQLPVIVKDMKCKKLGLAMIDYLDRGRIIDIPAHNRLPASFEERRDMPRNQWTNVQNDPSPESMVLTEAQHTTLKEYDDLSKVVFEGNLLSSLREMREVSDGYQRQYDAGETFDLPLESRLKNIKGVANDIDDANDSSSESDDDESHDQAATGVDNAQPPIEGLSALGINESGVSDPHRAIRHQVVQEMHDAVQKRIDKALNEHEYPNPDGARLYFFVDSCNWYLGLDKPDWMEVVDPLDLDDLQIAFLTEEEIMWINGKAEGQSAALETMMEDAIKNHQAEEDDDDDLNRILDEDDGGELPTRGEDAEDEIVWND